MTFRSMDPAWRSEMATFVTRVMAEVRPLLANHGGPVALLQIENEFGNIEQYCETPDLHRACAPGSDHPAVDVGSCCAAA